jgi:hypothetical protein
MILRILPLFLLLAGCSQNTEITVSPSIYKANLEEAFFRGALWEYGAVSGITTTNGVGGAADQAAREIMDRRGK